LDIVLDIHGFVDVDWDGDLDCRISTSRYVFNLFGGSTNWMSVMFPILLGVKLSAYQFPKTQEEEEDISYVPYASVVGILMYAMVCNRPNIAHAMGVLSRYMSKVGKEHWTIVKRVFMYLHDTTSYGLCYHGRPKMDRVLDIYGFVDVDWARDMNHKIYTSGYVFNLFGREISWMIKIQSVVALSTTEVEYMATTHARKEAI
jgi:hypothetical protein